MWSKEAWKEHDMTEIEKKQNAEVTIESLANASGSTNILS